MCGVSTHRLPTRNSAASTQRKNLRPSSPVVFGQQLTPATWCSIRLAVPHQRVSQRLSLGVTSSDVNRIRNSHDWRRVDCPTRPEVTSRSNPRRCPKDKLRCSRKLNISNGPCDCDGTD